MRKFSFFFFFIIISSFFSLTISADQIFEPFGHSDSSYSYDYSVNHLPRWGIAYDGNRDSVLEVAYYFDLTSVNPDGVKYNTRTLCYEPDSSVGLSGMNFTCVWNELWATYGSSYFTDFDIFFVVNVYGSGHTGNGLNARAVLTKACYADELGSDMHSIMPQCSLIDVVERHSESYTYVYQVSYHGDPVFFDLNDYDISTFTIEFYSQNFSGSIVSSLYDVCLGILDARIGRVFEPVDYDSAFLPPGLNDIWSGLDPLPTVVYPNFGNDSVTLKVESLYSSLASSDIVATLLVPIGLVAMSFFNFRLVLWKGL